MFKILFKVCIVKWIVEVSLGSMVFSMGVIGWVLWGYEGVEVWVMNKKMRESLRVLRFFGVGM